MYTFVYWFFYKFFIWRKGFESSFIASSMVGLAIIFHLIFLYSVIRYVTGQAITLGLDQYAYGIRRLILLPFVFLFFLAIDQLYFRKSQKLIFAKYQLMKPFSKKNIIVIVSVLVVPLVIGILLLQGANLKWG